MKTVFSQGGGVMSGYKSIFAAVVAVLGVILMGGRATPAQAYEYTVIKTQKAYFLYYGYSGYVNKEIDWCDASLTLATCKSGSLMRRYEKDLATYNSMVASGFTPYRPAPKLSDYTMVSYLDAAAVVSKTVAEPTAYTSQPGSMVGPIGADRYAMELMFGTSVSRAEVRTEIETQISSTAAARKAAVANSAAGDSAGNQLLCPVTGCTTGITAPARQVVRTLDDGTQPLKITPHIPTLPTR